MTTTIGVVVVVAIVAAVAYIVYRMKPKTLAEAASDVPKAFAEVKADAAKIQPAVAAVKAEAAVAKAAVGGVAAEVTGAFSPNSQSVTPASGAVQLETTKVVDLK